MILHLSPTSDQWGWTWGWQPGCRATCTWVPRFWLNIRVSRKKKCVCQCPISFKFKLLTRFVSGSQDSPRWEGCELWRVDKAGKMGFCSLNDLKYWLQFSSELKLVPPGSLLRLPCRPSLLKRVLFKFWWLLVNEIRAAETADIFLERAWSSYKNH